MCGFCRGTKYVSYSTTRNHLSVYGDMLNPSVGKLYSFYYVAIIQSIVSPALYLLIHKELEEEECAMSTDNDDDDDDDDPVNEHIVSSDGENFILIVFFRIQDRFQITNKAATCVLAFISMIQAIIKHPLHLFFPTTLTSAVQNAGQKSYNFVFL